MTAAEALNDAVGGMIGRNTIADKHLGLDDINHMYLSDIDSPLPPPPQMRPENNPDFINYPRV